jgi:hypothetical protein
MEDGIRGALREGMWEKEGFLFSFFFISLSDFIWNHLPVS